MDRKKLNPIRCFPLSFLFRMFTIFPICFTLGYSNYGKGLGKKWLRKKNQKVSLKFQAQ